MDNYNVANSFCEYVQLIEEIAKREPIVRKWNDVILFRGQSDITYDLTPSINRETSSEEPLLFYESNMISQAKGKRPDIFFDDEIPINLLVKLQHFGVPTRLLDVTHNSLVALYFACENIKKNDVDGEVFVFRPCKGRYGMEIKNYDNRDINFISQMYRTRGFSGYSLKDLIDDTGTDLSRNNYVWDNGTALFTRQEYHFDDFVKKISVPNFVTPVELSERQKRQQGAFILFPNVVVEKGTRNSRYYYEITDKLVNIDKNDSCIISKIVIPGKRKAEIINSLRLFGITEEFLFPDNVDIICKTIKEDFQY